MVFLRGQSDHVYWSQHCNSFNPRHLRNSVSRGTQEQTKKIILMPQLLVQGGHQSRLTEVNLFFLELTLFPICKAQRALSQDLKVELNIQCSELQNDN